jgi:hypothetical protein
MQKVLLLILVFSPLFLFAQVPYQIGARANGLANSTLVISDVWAVRNNIGAIGELDKTEVGLAYQNKYMLKEFSNQSLAVNYAARKGSFGLYFQQAGFNLYREVTTGIGYGMRLSNNFSAGLSLNYHRISFGDIYGAKNSISASVGLKYNLNKNIQFGANVANLNRAQITEVEDERFPTMFGLGMKYVFSEKAFWTVELEKDILHPINVKSGLELKAHEILVLRLGMNSYPFQTAFGVGVKLKKWRLDIAANWHSSLGINPSAGLVYQF